MSARSGKLTPDEYRDLLRRHDDPVHLEWPGGWTLESRAANRAAQQKFADFAKDVQQVLGHSCVAESGAAIQDASFLGQITLPRHFFADDYIAALRVSNFGTFATVYDDDSSVLPDCLDKIKALVEQHGYIYIPPVILREPYISTDPAAVDIKNWGIRYFDWL